MRKGLRPLPHFNPVSAERSAGEFPAGAGGTAHALAPPYPRRKPAPRFRSANPLILFRISGNAPPAGAGFPACRDGVLPSRAPVCMPCLNPQAGFGSAGSFVIRLPCLSSRCRKSLRANACMPPRLREGSFPRIRAEGLTLRGQVSRYGMR